MTKLLFILLFCLPLNLLAQHQVKFIGENIDFEIDKQKFSVNGIYYFVNTTNEKKVQGIKFPFSHNSDSLKVKRVFNLSYFQNISYEKLDKAISFKVNILPKDTIMVNIAYSEKTQKENEYILASTQAWGEPLKWADYSLTVDKFVHIENLSLPADSINKNVYYWKKKEFYPKKNFKIGIK